MPLAHTDAVRACPCGSGTPLPACCGPLLLGARVAETPEELMRSRYTAYALGDDGHVFRTWHPSTRPADVTGDPQLTWTGLRIVDTADDEVEFVASYEIHDPDGAVRHGQMHERSRFARRAGRWMYLDGAVE